MKEEFLAWMTNRLEKEEGTLDEDWSGFHFSNLYGSANIAFYDGDVVELHVSRRSDQKDMFYLHFCLNDLARAKELFEEMLDVYASLKNQSTKKILLSCSCGITTAMFAAKLDECAKSFELDYEFEAVDVNEIASKIGDYDMLLLAPQIEYQHEAIVRMYPGKQVLRIPASLFGRFDAAGTVLFIRDYFEEQSLGRKKADESWKIPNSGLADGQKVLLIGDLNAADASQLDFQVYSGPEKIDEQKIIKPVVTRMDIKDIIEIMLLKYPDIQAVSIALPGVIDEGEIYMPENGYVYYNLQEYLEDMFDLPVCLINDVNAAACGYHIRHPECENFLFHFQPSGMPEAGQALFLDGKLYEGFHGFAGEVKYLLRQMNFSQDISELLNTPQGYEELIAKMLMPALTSLSPELVCLYCPVLENTDGIRGELEMKIPFGFIPEIRMVHHMQEYMFAGLLDQAASRLEQLETQPVILADALADTIEESEAGLENPV